MPRPPRTAPRKTPRQARARTTVDAILQATAHILVNEGYDRASTNRVAQQAGVSVGSLYQYFPSKEALVAALIEKHNGEMMGACRERLMALHQEPLEVAGRELVRALLRAHSVNPRLHKVLLEQVPRVGRLAQLDLLKQHLSSLIQRYLEARREELRPRNLELATFVLVQAVQAVTAAATFERPEALATDELAEEVSQLVLSYLLRESGRQPLRTAPGRPVPPPGPPSPGLPAPAPRR